MKTILITGATSGIGLATAKIFAQNNFKIIITSRKQENLDKTTTLLDNSSNVLALKFDVSKREETYIALQNLPPEFAEIDILVNNAGNAYGLESIPEGNEQDWDNMIDINVKGLLNVTKALTPKMMELKKGHIINVGSLAGYEVYPNGGVYCASKYAVRAITEGLRKDLNAFEVKVSSINPGLVETNFSNVRFNGDTEKASKVYQGFSALQAEDVAETIYFMATRKDHVNLAEVLILPKAQASATMVLKKL
jgi:3-hydroxy acid dehydrogenase / malonic semialdehyde reductase